MFLVKSVKTAAIGALKFTLLTLAASAQIGGTGWSPVKPGKTKNVHRLRSKNYGREIKLLTTKHHMTITCAPDEITHHNDQGQAAAMFCSLSRLATQFRIRANVLIETRILHKFSALTLGENLSAEEAVPSVLAFRCPLLSDGIMSVCLVRRCDGNTVVAEVTVSCQDELGHESLFLRLGKVRQLGLPAGLPPTAKTGSRRSP